MYAHVHISAVYFQQQTCCSMFCVIGTTCLLNFSFTKSQNDLIPKRTKTSVYCLWSCSLHVLISISSSSINLSTVHVLDIVLGHRCFKCIIALNLWMGYLYFYMYILIKEIVYYNGGHTLVPVLFVAVLITFFLLKPFSSCTCLHSLLH